MPREIEAWAIFGKRLKKPHLDKIMRSPAEAWGLLSDELMWSLGKGRLTTADMRRMGYECRKVKITWRDLRR